MDPVVIVGSGLAGYTLARELRKLDKNMPVRLITRDDGSAYSKPMLSNALSKSKTPGQLASATAEQTGEQLGMHIDTHTEVTAIDRQAHRLVTSCGDVAYSKLVLALGADPIHLNIDGDGVDAVMSINDLADYTRFREVLNVGNHVAIMGAGLIGCEFANDLLETGYKVTVIDPMQQPLGRLLPPECADDLKTALASRGVDWRFENTVRRIDRKDSAFSLTLASGDCLTADLVLSAVGLRARTGLAVASGLSCQRGIQVDRLLATSDPDIHALGDCAEVEGLFLPFVMPIMHAARALAKTLTGNPAQVTYPAMPVVVKTPACPLVVSPPAAGVTGLWQIEQPAPGSTRACFYDAGRQLLGFALTGDAAGEKQALTKLLPPALA